MKILEIKRFWLIIAAAFILVLQANCQKEQMKSVTVPFILDHNRMLIEAEVGGIDGKLHKEVLWVDTGNPDFLVNEKFAIDAGIEISNPDSVMKIPSTVKILIGGIPVNCINLNLWVDTVDKWLFNTMHNDGNLPSTVLKNYHIIFDYPRRQLTIADPGILKPQGIPSPASINKNTGIIQMDATIDGEKYSFALDNGASFSFVPETIITKLINRHANWPTIAGAVGCANIWGWWQGEGTWPLIRIPEIRWGTLNIQDAVFAGLPPRGGIDIGTRYSRKTARPVNGFIGHNIFKDYRIEIIYNDSTLYFEKGPSSDIDEMDIIGLTLKPLNDGRYRVLAVTKKNGKPILEGVQQGDILLQIDTLITTGATMGTVVDALRGKNGDKRVLLLERDGKQFSVIGHVERIF
jgi:hypothetical protein